MPSHFLRAKLFDFLHDRCCQIYSKEKDDVFRNRLCACVRACAYIANVNRPLRITFKHPRKGYCKQALAFSYSIAPIAAWLRRFASHCSMA